MSPLRRSLSIQPSLGRTRISTSTHGRSKRTAKCFAEKGWPPFLYPARTAMYPEGYSTMVEPPAISRTLGRCLSARSLSRCGDDRAETVSVPALRSSRLRPKGLSAVESHRGDGPRLERWNRDCGWRDRSRVRWFGDEQPQSLSQRLRTGSGTSHLSKSLVAAGRAQSTQGQTDVRSFKESCRATSDGCARRSGTQGAQWSRQS